MAAAAVSLHRLSTLDPGLHNQQNTRNKLPLKKEILAGKEQHSPDVIIRLEEYAGINVNVNG